ncbi:MAG: alpha/beta fold hydrolase [Armatimonadota bacterium]
MPVINVDGLRVSYTDAGSGTPIVFVPGLAGSKEWFCYQASGLADRYRIISYDLRRARGHTAYSLDVLVNDLTRFLAALRIYSAIIAGHSLGGLVALKFASLHPERCPAVVLCSTTPAYPNCSDDDFISQLLPGEVKFESAFAKWWKKWFGGKRRAEEEADPYERLSGTLSELDHLTLTKRLEILRGTDLRAELDQIEVPTLVIASTGDTPYVLGGSQCMEEGIPDSTMELIESAERFYFYTRHDLFNAILADYLAEKIALF